MNYARYPKSEDEPRCQHCGHTNPAEKDGSCSGIEVNIDYFRESSPCECKAHVLSVDKRRISGKGECSELYGDKQK